MVMSKGQGLLGSIFLHWPRGGDWLHLGLLSAFPSSVFFLLAFENFSFVFNFGNKLFLHLAAEKKL